MHGFVKIKLNKCTKLDLKLTKKLTKYLLKKTSMKTLLKEDQCEDFVK